MANWFNIEVAGVTTLTVARLLTDGGFVATASAVLSRAERSLCLQNDSGSSPIDRAAAG